MSLKVVCAFWFGVFGGIFFVISVGNISPNSTTVIKITYITELSFWHGCITFHVPVSVSPETGQQGKALNENTQVC